MAHGNKASNLLSRQPTTPRTNHGIYQVLDNECVLVVRKSQRVRMQFKLFPQGRRRDATGQSKFYNKQLLQSWLVCRSQPFAFVPVKHLLYEKPYVTQWTRNQIK